MPWPGLNDFQEALQQPQRAFQDVDLQSGTVTQNRLGLPMSWSGNFATVFKVTANSRDYAIRCFTHNPIGMTQRYEAIARHLNTNGWPNSFIDFEYQENGLICRNQTYPLIKMQWIQGQTLDEFTYRNIDNPDVLKRLVEQWYTAATELQRLPIAHNDLQHGNIIVEPAALAPLKLVDYDGLYLPQFANQPSPENGHRHYQHPKRDQSDYGPFVDNFPALVVYTSLTALAHDQGARFRRATSESLLFSQDDLQDPQNSRLFEYLQGSSHSQTAHLAAALREATLAPIADTPTLERIQAPQARAPLPNWLNQPTVPNIPTWQIPVTTPTQQIPGPPTPVATTTPRPDLAQHNRNLIDEHVQAIGHLLKPSVIQYTKDAQSGNWSFDYIRGQTSKHIKSINELENSTPDTTALIAILLSITAYRQNEPLAKFGITRTTLENVRNIRNEHAHNLRDFSDQVYVDGTISTLRHFRESIDKLPQHLPKRPPGNQSHPNNRGNQPNRQKNQGQQSTQTQQPTSPIPTIPQSTSAPILEQILAITLLLSTVFTVVLIALIATPRISIQDWGLLLVVVMLIIGVVLIISSGYGLWKTNDRPVDLLLHDLTIAASSFWNVIERVIRAIRQIQNRKAKWTVSISLTIVVIAMVSSTSIYLSRPNITAISPDPNTASPAEAPKSTQIPNNPEDLSPLSNAVTKIPLENTSQDQHLSSLATEYAHCNRAYSNQEAEARAQAITQVIASSTTNIDEIRRFVHKECPPIPVNNDATKQPTPQPTTTRAYSPQTTQSILPSTDQPSTQNPIAIPPVEIPTVTPAPSPTPNPYHISTSLKPSHVQQLDADGGLLSSQNYEIAACYYDPHDTEPPRKWKLFTQPDQSLLEPVFTIHFTEPINLQHGLCYEFNVSYMGPTEWRVCASQPYGGNCEHNSSDFLWEREIPAFRGKQDSATYVWTPDPDKR